MKKLIAGILCMAILFTACNSTVAPSSGASVNGATPQSAATKAKDTALMGRWVEEPMSIPDNMYVFGLHRIKDDSIICLATDREGSSPKLVSTDNGVTWQEAASSWANVNIEADENIAFTTMNESGVLMFAKVKKDRSFTLWLQKPTEKAVQLNFADIPADAALRSFALIDDKTAVITWQIFYPDHYDNFGAIFNLETQTKIKALEDDFDYDGGALYFQPYTQYNDELYFVSFKSDKGNYTLQKYTAAGELSTVHDALPTHSSSVVDKEGNYYFVNEKGVFRLAKNGSIVENIVSNNSFAYAAPNTSVGKLCIAADGSILVNYVGGTGNENTERYSKRYYFDKSLPPESNSSTLKVWSLESNETVRAAIVNFAEQHSDIAVEYETAITPETKEITSREDVLRVLNASILAGEGPDVIIFDNINYSPYIQKELLTDLSTVLDFKALLPNISAPFIKDGKAFVMPAKYNVPILYGPPQGLKALSTLEGLQKAILAAKPRPNIDLNSKEYYTPLAEKDKYALGFVDIRQLFDFAMSTSANAIIEGNTINQAALKTMLGFVKAISDHYGMASYSKHDKNGVAVGGSEGDTFNIWDGGYEYNFVNNAIYGWNIMQSPAMLTNVDYENPETKEKIVAAAILQPGLCEGAYLPNTFIGININTKNHDAAAEFVKTVFSDKTQGTFNNDGSPVTINGNDAMFKRNTAALSTFSGDASALYSALKTPVILNTSISDIIYKHTEQLCMNKQSLEEAITGIKNDLAIYLEEKD